MAAMLRCRCGFGLLMYGFGSKKLLLEDFASTTLTDFTVIVVNGYLPSINLKQVCHSVLTSLPVEWLAFVTRSFKNLRSLLNMYRKFASSSLELSVFMDE